MKTTEQKNRLIAEFMGKEIYQYHHESFYHSSWDWLMPVVEKIEGLGYSVKIQRIKTSIHPILEDAVLFSWVCGYISKKLEITYNTVVQFIEWYNNQK